MLRTTTTTNNKKQSKKFLSFCLSCFFSLFFLNFQCSILSDNVDDDKRPEDKPSTDRSIGRSSISISTISSAAYLEQGSTRPPLPPQSAPLFFFYPPPPFYRDRPRPHDWDRSHCWKPRRNPVKPGKTQPNPVQPSTIDIETREKASFQSEGANLDLLSLNRHFDWFKLYNDVILGQWTIRIRGNETFKRPWLWIR